jgi:hypothetical protein
MFQRIEACESVAVSQRDRSRGLLSAKDQLFGKTPSGRTSMEKGLRLGQDVLNGSSAVRAGGREIAEVHEKRFASNPA